MKPSPSEVVKGIRALLREAASEITNAKNSSNYRRAMAILRDTRWDEAGFDVLAENAAMAEALRMIRSDQPDAVSGLSEEIERVLADRTAPTSFAAANARNGTVRDLLARTLDAVAAHDLRASAPLRIKVTELLLELRTTDPR